MGFHKRLLIAAVVVATAALSAVSGVAQDQASPAVSSPAPAAPVPVMPTAPPTAPANQARLARGQAIPPAELEAFVDGFATKAMAQDHIAGAAVVVVQNGQTVFKKGYGVDRLQPVRAVDPDRTLFRIGGVTKTFTWIALMREIEAGHIRLDAPINVYLPEKDQIPDQGYKRQIQIRDLLTHTTGFENRSFGQKMEDEPGRVRPLDVYLRQERPRRVREAGALPTYGDYGAALAGEALVQVTGRPMQTLLESEITGPLGLRRTTLREPYPRRGELPEPLAKDLAGDISQGFRWTGSAYGDRPFEFMSQAAPADAASASAQDMGRYMLAVLGDGTVDGVSIYSPALAKDFRTALQRSAPGVGGWDYGFMEYALPGGFQGFGHPGATLSFRANLVTIPALGLGVFVAANTETGEGLTAALASAVVGRFYAPPAQLAPEPSAWLKDHAAAFAGGYLTTQRAYTGMEQFANLLQDGARVSVTPDGVLLTPGREGPHRWTPAPGASLDAPYVTFQEVGGPNVLVFEMKDGQAQRWFAPSGRAAYERSNLFAQVWLVAALAAATGAASIGAIGSLFLRDRREFRQTTVQGWADAAQVSSAILWLGGLVCFGIWELGASDEANLVYGWPGPWLVIASACAFVATVLTVVGLGLLPIVWRGGRRLDSWTAGRKARFTVSTLVFALFAVMLGLWGALEPWRS